MKGKYIPPVVIGGVGGSGTRVIAEFLKNIGYNIGDDLNESKDNLTFTLLFKRLSILSKTNQEMRDIIKVFYKIMHAEKLTDLDISIIDEASLEYFKPNEVKWIKDRVSYIHTHKKSSLLWGWKEPNSHIVLENLYDFFPKLKYIHVVRNGLDMAYSKNQIQLNLWGKNILSKEFIDINPKNSLKYWCKIHKRVKKIINDNDINAFILDFDALVKGSKIEEVKLMKFLELDNLNKLYELIEVPKSMGRYEKYGLESFDKEDVQYALDFFDKGL